MTCAISQARTTFRRAQYAVRKVYDSQPCQIFVASLIGAVGDSTLCMRARDLCGIKHAFTYQCVRGCVGVGMRLRLHTCKHAYMLRIHACIQLRVHEPAHLNAIIYVCMPASHVLTHPRFMNASVQARRRPGRRTARTWSNAAAVTFLQ